MDLERNEIPIHAAIWMNLEKIMLSETDTKAQILYNFTYMRYLG